MRKRRKKKRKTDVKHVTYVESESGQKNIYYVENNVR